MKTPEPWIRGLVLAVVALACGSPEGTGGTDASAGMPDGWPAARDDLVPSVGTPYALDLATWNVENFPATGATARIVADLVRSMHLDLVAVQEIADRSAFEELVGRLPEHEGVLSTHFYGNGTYQKVGFVYRSDLLEVTDVRHLFEDEGYVFPRPPLQVTVTSRDGARDFVTITVHLKAGFDADDRDRRARATALLEEHVRSLVDGPGDGEVVILGDFNEVLSTDAGRATLDPWLASPDRYRMRTQAMVDRDEASFLPTGVVLDHVVSTSALEDEFGADVGQIPRLDLSLGDYESTVSDHLPVVVSMPSF